MNSNSGKEDVPLEDIEANKKKITKDESSPSSSGFFWLGWWFALNVGLTLMNKSFFAVYGFKFPIALSLVHMLLSSICSLGTLSYLNITQQTFQKKDQVSLMAFSVLFCANIMTGNLALNFVSVSLVQVVRSTIPGITMFLSMIILGKQYDRTYYYTISMVVFGVAIASLGEVEFHAIGFVWTVTVCFLSSLKSVMTAKFLVGSLKLHEFDLLQRMSTYAIPQLTLASLLFETEGIRLWWRENGTLQFLFILTFNGFMAFLLNWCNFMTTKKTSALTVTVAGNVKHIVTIALSIMVFSTPLSFMNGLGIIITVIGAAIYSYLEYEGKKSRG